MRDRRSERPKIARRLAEPGAAVVREIVGAALKIGTAPTLLAGTRQRTSSFIYGDPENPDRPTELVHSPDFTLEDYALIIGLEEYQATLCRCGWPKQIAWHAEMEGWFDQDGGVVCHACTAAQEEPEKGPRRPVVYYPRPSTSYDTTALPPFIFGETTTPS